jgi:hypothetical protein
VSSIVDILSDNRFEHPDVGDINDSANIDYWVVCIPKCATTSIQRGLQRVGKEVIHIHTNSSLHEAYPNGDVLKAAGIGVEQLIQHRLASSDRKLHCFFGYREPVSWWVSLAGQFSLDYASLSERPDKVSRDNHPWNKYSIDDIAVIIRNAFGVDLMDHAFDAGAGLSVLEHERFNIVLYRFDRMDAVEDYIRARIDDRFVMKSERVNGDAAYLDFKRTFKPSADAAERLYDDPWCRYFYSPSERDGLLNALWPTSHVAEKAERSGVKSETWR